MLRNQNIERKKHNPEYQYKLDREYNALFSTYAQKKLKNKEKLQENKIIEEEALNAQNALYDFVMQNDYDIPLHRIEVLEDRFKKVLMLLSNYFPDNKNHTQQSLADNIKAYIEKMELKEDDNDGFKHFIRRATIKNALIELLQPIKLFSEEILNLYLEINSITAFQDNSMLGNDSLLPFTIRLLQEVYKKNPNIPNIAHSDAFLKIIFLLKEIVKENDSVFTPNPIDKHFHQLHFYYQHLISSWETAKNSSFSPMKEEKKNEIDKLYLDLALLTQPQTQTIALPSTSQAFPTEEIIPILQAQRNAFDYKVYFNHYRKILEAPTIEEAIFKILSLGKIIQQTQLKHQLTDEGLKEHLQKANFGAVNLLKPIHVASIPAIKEALQNITLELKNEQNPEKNAQLAALKVGFNFFYASAQLDKTFKKNLTTSPLSTHAILKHPLSATGNFMEIKQRFQKNTTKTNSTFNYQMKKAEAYIKRDLSFSSIRRKMNNWYHRRTPIEKFLICSSFVTLTVAAIITLAITGVGAPIGTLIAVGAAKATGAYLGASTLSASIVGASTEIAVATTCISFTVGVATALSLKVNNALNPVSPVKILKTFEEQNELPPKKTEIKSNKDDIKKTLTQKISSDSNNYFVFNHRQRTSHSDSKENTYKTLDTAVQEWDFIGQKGPL